MTKTLSERFPAPDVTTLSPQAQEAIKAMERTHKELRERKKALGQKFVIWENGKVVTVDP